MNITRFEPWSYVDLMQRNLKRPAALKSNARWTPAVDIIEEKDGFTLRADVPGVGAHDIEITMDAGILNISGSRMVEKSDDEATLRRSERVSGQFFRQFSLPDTADGDNIKARTSNGILEITIPKLAEVAARQIKVEAA